MVLAEYLGASPHPIHAIGFFVGDSMFKKMPENVINLFSQGQVDRLAWVVEHNLANSLLTKRHRVNGTNLLLTALNVVLS